MRKKILYGIGVLILVPLVLGIIGAIAGPTEPKVAQTVEQTDQVVSANTEVEATPSITETVKTESPKPVEAKTTQQVPATSAPASQYTYYSVTDVVDGDTLKISMNGSVETLRLIGIDTPETVDPRKPVQCFGKEASNKAKELLIGKKVRIEKDSSQGERDKYDRLLAYIYREDGLFFNKQMIEQGYAHEYTYDSAYKYQAEFKAAQKAAQTAQAGLWSPNTCNGDTTSSSQTEPATTQSGFYTSSHSSSKYYYPASCDGWKSLSASYLKSFSTLEALLAAYPSRTKSPQCQ